MKACPLKIGALDGTSVIQSTPTLKSWEHLQKHFGKLEWFCLAKLTGSRDIPSPVFPYLVHQGAGFSHLQPLG